MIYEILLTGLFIFWFGVMAGIMDNPSGVNPK